MHKTSLKSARGNVPIKALVHGRSVNTPIRWRKYCNTFSVYQGVGEKRIPKSTREILDSRNELGHTIFIPKKLGNMLDE